MAKFPDSQLRALDCHKIAFYRRAAHSASLTRSHKVTNLPAFLALSLAFPSFRLSQMPSRKKQEVSMSKGSCANRKDRKSFVLDYFLSHRGGRCKYTQRQLDLYAIK